ncbi:polygalacturonase non-catalytic subunit AroGP3 [Andrographis paniculata]|uniref:polygalacturonase non-catalytic subunit AroGP3 n=1 Tax=Andrographis paniculata TaxID=175694 RepID=UPI0021E8EA6C|nr:polygalacturonase non-catalytic subunit AroGP3 [Andrographis paniculata]
MRLLLFFFLLLSFNTVAFVLAGGAQNPFSPKGYAIRYWNNKIAKNGLPKPSFLIDKASPLTAADCAVFAKLAGDATTLSGHLHDFCSKANLFCRFDSSPSLKKRKGNEDFDRYNDRDFSNYGSGRLGAGDSFRTYSEEFGLDTNNFRRYSRRSVGHSDGFASYARKKNMPEQSFNGYGTMSAGGKGEFSSYDEEVNVPHVKFIAYSGRTDGRRQTFKEYATDANSGEEGFAGYSKESNGDKNEFASYATNSNVVTSDFKRYREFGNGGNDSFSSYGFDTNVPQNTFQNYATKGNGGIEKFDNYRADTNGGSDEFNSYGKKSSGEAIDFQNYAGKNSGGNSTFTSYARDADGQTVDFKVYGQGRTFKEYAKEGVMFSQYTNTSSAAMAAAAISGRGKKVNSSVVEPGRFFREEMLKKGTIMPMPDIRDKMPRRSFLPRSISSKLPFSTSKITELQKIFHAGKDSSMAKMMRNSLMECERAPNPNETKQCVASIEDMIDFATSVLGRNLTVRTTESTRGYNSKIMIGGVKGIGGGEVTASVSCHESSFPYLVYYCHAVPKVRVYEAEILDPESRARMNLGVAVCHLDTSSWSPTHGAFLALGPGPGKIEVCHWIFHNDMTWTAPN